MNRGDLSLNCVLVLGIDESELTLGAVVWGVHNEDKL